MEKRCTFAWSKKPPAKADGRLDLESLRFYHVDYLITCLSYRFFTCCYRFFVRFFGFWNMQTLLAPKNTSFFSEKPKVYLQSSWKPGNFWEENSPTCFFFIGFPFSFRVFSTRKIPNNSNQRPKTAKHQRSSQNYPSNIRLWGCQLCLV